MHPIYTPKKPRVILFRCCPQTLEQPTTTSYLPPLTALSLTKRLFFSPKLLLEFICIDLFVFYIFIHCVFRVLSKLLIHLCSPPNFYLLTNVSCFYYVYFVFLFFVLFIILCIVCGHCCEALWVNSVVFKYTCAIQIKLT